MKSFSDQKSTRLLIATTGPQRQKIVKALGGHFDLSFVSTMAEARASLELKNSRSVALVICSVDFDESRMFDMLRHLRTSNRFKTLPFVAVEIQYPTSPNTGNAKAAMELMGSGFVRLSEFGDDEEEQALLDTVLISLVKTNVQERSSAEGN